MKITVYLPCFQLSLPPTLWPVLTAWGICLHLSLCLFKITANNNSKILAQCLLQNRHCFLFLFFYHMIYSSLFNPHSDLKGSTRVFSRSPESPERLHLSMQRVQVWPLVRELRFPYASGPKTNKQKLKENRRNIVTNSIKTF